MCSVCAMQDLVGLKLGPNLFKLYYQDSFRIAAGMLQSAKLAARFDGVSPGNWNSHIERELRQQAPSEPQHRTYRRSAQMSNIATWKVGFERSLVVLTFDETVVHIPYEDAFKVYASLRLEARNAKRWAGDCGRQMSTRANLVSAEENDRFVYVD